MATTRPSHSPRYPGPDEDLELVKGALAGRAEAVRDLGERLRCVPRILSAINGRRGAPLSAHDLEDLSQEVLVRIWRKLGTFQGHVTFEFWCHRFCYLETMNWLRRLSRWSLVRSGSPTRTDPVTPTHAPIAEEQLQRIEEALARLDPTLEEVVRMKTFERLGFDEMGKRLGIPAATAKSRYYRALSELRDHLERTGDGG